MPRTFSHEALVSGSRIVVGHRTQITSGNREVKVAPGDSQNLIEDKRARQLLCYRARSRF